MVPKKLYRNTLIVLLAYVLIQACPIISRLTVLEFLPSNHFVTCSVCSPIALLHKIIQHDNMVISIITVVIQ